MNDIKQVIVVRKDIRLRRSELASNVAHASMKFLIDNNESERGDEISLRLSSEEARWIQGSSKKIIVGVSSEEALKNLMFKAEISGISVYPVFKTSLDENVETLTCAAFGPDESSVIDELTKNLKLI